METTQLPLRDIHLPEVIGWWPPAPGWWLTMILIPLLLGLGFWCFRRLTRKTAVKLAKKQLTLLLMDKHQDNADKLKHVSMLIRRTAISVAPRNDCASLTGKAWLEFLDSSLSGKPFSEGTGRLLADAPYRAYRPSDGEIADLVRLCEEWLKKQAKRKS